MSSEEREIIEIVLHSLSLEPSEETFIKAVEETYYGDRIYEEPLGSDFLRLISNETDLISLILTAHLFIENFLNTIIKVKFKYPEIILEEYRFSLLLKLAVLRAANRITLNMYKDIKLINTLRNRISHNLYYDISEFDLSQFTHFHDLYDFIKPSNKKVQKYLCIIVLKLKLPELLFQLTARYPEIAKLKSKDI